MPIISIIVPVYNIEEYVGVCLKALCNQNASKEDYQIIVIDDGSNDRSGDIIDEYAKNYPNVISLHQPNGGVSSARNLGLEHATGDYIWFVDGDDTVNSSSIKIILENLKKNAYPDLLYIGVKAFERDEELPPKNELLDIAKETQKYSGWMFTRIMKSDVIFKNNITFDTDISLGEDDVFCVFFIQHMSTTAKIDKVLYYYRQRQGSALRSEITEENFERVVKSNSASLNYAKKYDFFWYKKDMVYKFMPNIMVFIAQQPRKKSKLYLNKLKENNLFPLKQFINSDNYDSKKMNGAKKIRNRSYESYFRYYILRLYLVYQDILKKHGKIEN